MTTTPEPRTWFTATELAARDAQIAAATAERIARAIHDSLALIPDDGVKAVAAHCSALARKHAALPNLAAPRDAIPDEEFVAFNAAMMSARGPDVPANPADSPQGATEGSAAQSSTPASATALSAGCNCGIDLPAAYPFHMEDCNALKEQR